MTLIKPFHTSQAVPNRGKIDSILNAKNLTHILLCAINIGRGQEYFAVELYYIWYTCTM